MKISIVISCLIAVIVGALSAPYLCHMAAISGVMPSLKDRPWFCVSLNELFIAGLWIITSWIVSNITGTTLLNTMGKSVVCIVPFFVIISLPFYFPEKMLHNWELFTPFMENPLLLYVPFIIGFTAFCFMAVVVMRSTGGQEEETAGIFRWNFLALYLIYGIGIFLFTVKQYATYNTIIDFGIFGQSYHYASNTGIFYNTLEGIPGQVVNHFAIHNSPIFYLVLPFYMIFKNAAVLLVANGLLIWISIVPMFILVRRNLSYYPALILSFAFMVTPTIMFRHTGQFYEMSFAPPFILLTIYFYQGTRLWYFFIFLILTMTIKEHLFLTGFIFSLYALMDRRPKIWVTVPLLTAICWFILTFKVIMPQARGGSPLGLLMYEYGAEAQSITSFLSYMIKNPQIIMQKLTGFISIRYLYAIFIPVLLILPFLSRWVVLAIPLIAVNIILIRWSMNILSHYSLDFLPVLYMASAESIGWLSRRSWLNYLGRKNIQYALCITILSAVLVQSPSWYFAKQSYSNGRVQSVRKVKGMIPDDASFASSKALLPYFAERKMISYISFKYSPFSFPYGTQYLLYDIETPQMTPPYKKAIKFLLSPRGGIPGYNRIFSDDHVLLFKKDNTAPDFFDWIDEREMAIIANSREENSKQSRTMEEDIGHIKVANIVHRVWVEYTDQGDIYYQRTDLETRQAVTPLRLTATTGHSRSPQITSDAYGGIHIVWVEQSENSVIHYKYIDDMWGPWCINEVIGDGDNPRFLYHDEEIFLSFENTKGQKKTVMIKKYWVNM